MFEAKEETVVTAARPLLVPFGVKEGGRNVD